MANVKQGDVVGIRGGGPPMRVNLVEGNRVHVAAFPMKLAALPQFGWFSPDDVVKLVPKRPEKS